MSFILCPFLEGCSLEFPFKRWTTVIHYNSTIWNLLQRGPHVQPGGRRRRPAVRDWSCDSRRWSRGVASRSTWQPDPDSLPGLPAAALHAKTSRNRTRGRRRGVPLGSSSRFLTWTCWSRAAGPGTTIHSLLGYNLPLKIISHYS